MAKRSRSGTEYLEMHGGKWRVTVAVPESMRKAFGTRLKQSLHTDSLTVANQRKWKVIAEFQARIEAERRKLPGSAEVAYAQSLAAELRKADSREAEERVREAIFREAESIGGEPIGMKFDHDEGEVVPFYDPDRERKAREFIRIAEGKAVAIDAHHARYLEQLKVKARTRADDVRALGYLMSWCKQVGLPPHLSTMTQKTCARFMDDLRGLAGGVSEVTANKYLRRLSRYWQWLATRAEVPKGVWQGVVLDAPTVPHDEKERPFTADEMRKLLNGEAPQHMHDLMRIAALTGARLDAIVCLRVRDCDGGAFTFKPQKKEPGPRLCPIHPVLKEIVERRCAGRMPDEPLFPEWPAPIANSLRETSFKASNAFTSYRRSVGVDATVPGKRRALTNFHSFRRWFVTAAEQADQPEHIIAAVVGHKRKGITLSVYSSGPKLEQARRCVEAVHLPEGCGGGLVLPEEPKKARLRPPSPNTGRSLGTRRTKAA